MTEEENEENEENKSSEDTEKESEDKNEARIDNDPDRVRVSEVKEKVQRNPWVVSTWIFVIIAIVLAVMAFRGGFGNGIGTGNVIAADEASDLLLDYLNSRVGGGVEYLSHEDLGNIYEITVEYQDQELPVYITKDGEYFIQGAVPLVISDANASDTDTQITEVPKSDKPVVELFIWSYCPYGVQAQGPLADVVSLLGESADFEAVLYYDGHGAYETQQNKIQACIQEVAKDKYWDYAAGFVEEIYPECGASRDIDCDTDRSISLMDSLGIDSSEVMSCVEERGEDLIAEHSQRAGELGITGSPSLVINGVKVNTARNAEAFKTAVCEAFNEAPESCNQELESTGNTPVSGNC